MWFRDLPVLAGHIRADRLDLGALVTERIALEGIPAAFDDMLAGKGGRALLVFQGPSGHWPRPAERLGLPARPGPE